MEGASSSETPAAANGVGPSSSSSSSGGPSNTGGKQPLYLQYPVGSTWDFTLKSGDDNVIAGATVYCTDEVSDTVMVQKALTHTTLATEVRILQSSHILKAIRSATKDDGESSTLEAAILSQPLPKIQKKALEDRERRAIRLAEDSFRHINQKVSALCAVVPVVNSVPICRVCAFSLDFIGVL